MPELRPQNGWTEFRALVNMDRDQARGTLADTPARGLQWCYAVRQDMPAGITHWTVRFQVLAADQATVLLDTTLTVPILVTPGGGGFPAIWSSQNATVVTTVPSPVQTVSHMSEQPTILPLNSGDLPVYFEVYSALYELRLPAGALIHITHHELYVADLTFPPLFTSVLPGGGQRDTMIDPVTQDQYLPRVVSGMLLVRTTLHDGEAGPRTGLQLSYAAGVATVSAGSGVIGHQPVVAASALTLAVPTSGTHYLFLEPTSDGGLALTSDTGPVGRAAWCLGRVQAGTLTAASGVLVATGVTDGTERIARREDGRLVLRYDTDGGNEDVALTSCDRGVTWG